MLTSFLGLLDPRLCEEVPVLPVVSVAKGEWWVRSIAIWTGRMTQSYTGFEVSLETRESGGHHRAVPGWALAGNQE